MFEHFKARRNVLVVCLFALAACTTKPAQMTQSGNRADTPKAASSIQSSIIPGSANQTSQTNVGDTITSITIAQI